MPRQGGSTRGIIRNTFSNSQRKFSMKNEARNFKRSIRLTPLEIGSARNISIVLPILSFVGLIIQGMAINFVFAAIVSIIYEKMLKVILAWPGIVGTTVSIVLFMLTAFGYQKLLKMEYGIALYLLCYSMVFSGPIYLFCMAIEVLLYTTSLKGMTTTISTIVGLSLSSYIININMRELGSGPTSEKDQLIKGLVIFCGQIIVTLATFGALFAGSSALYQKAILM